MSNRRSFLRAAIASLGASVAGCTSRVDVIGEAGSQPTTTAVPEIPDAVFTFEYAPESRSLRITFKGGDRPRAGRLLLRSSDGTASRWNELGSTAVTETQRLRKGSTATLSESVINWRDPIELGERIKVVYRPNSDSPATVAQFDTRTAVTAQPTQTPAETEVPPSTERETPTATPTPTPTFTPTPTPTPSNPTLFADDFEDGSFQDRWTIGAQDDETIREENGYLLHRSPHNYNEGGSMRSVESVAAEGTQTITVEQRTRITNYWGYGFGVTDGDHAIDLKEHLWGDNNRLVLEGGSDGKQRLDSATTSTDVMEYTVTIDFDDGTVTEVTRGSETYAPEFSLPDGFDASFDVHLGDGRGHEVEYRSLRIEG